MTLALAPVMALAGKPAAATNTCDTSRKNRLARLQWQQATANGYTWMFVATKGEAELGGPFRPRTPISPIPSGRVSIPSELAGNKVKRIGDRPFWNCSELTAVTIPEGVVDIGPGAFSYCGKLTAVEIPSTVTNIGNGAFSGCGQLSSIKLPQGLKEIGFFAFMMCSKLESVTIPKSVAEIGNEAFAGCSQLKRIDVEAENPHFVSIDGVAYTKDRKELVVCPGGLTSVNILDGVTNIRDWAFSRCSGLASLEIPNSVTNIGRASFAGCPFAKVALPRGIRNIDIDAFHGCTVLSSITIPEGVTSIGDVAFANCSNLTSVTMLGVCPASSTNLFLQCNKLKEIHVPANSKSWAGMKEWQRVPLVFDGKALDPQKEKNLMESVRQETNRRENIEAWRVKSSEALRAKLGKRLQLMKEKVKRHRAQRGNTPNCNSTDEKAR